MTKICAIITVCVATFVGGCTHDDILPQSAALSSVHSTYTTELRAYTGTVPDPLVSEAVSENNSTSSAAIKATFDKRHLQANAFNGTLDSIRAFRIRFGKNREVLSQAFAHLDVLEGMVYLQTFEFGNAAAIKSRIKAAATELQPKQTGLAPRDRLLALSYEHLLNGWRQTYRYLRTGTNKNIDRGAMNKAAIGVKTVLDANIARNNDDPDLDSAGGYLALSAAIFWTWTHEFFDVDCQNGRTACTADVKTNRDEGTYICNAAQLLGGFLSSSEKAAVKSALEISENEDEADRKIRLPTSPASGRMTLIRWQIWFGEKLRSLEKRVEPCRPL
jgi:hypothetical protein